jgi:hypothetical protein
MSNETGEPLEPDLYRVIPDLEAETGEGPEDTLFFHTGFLDGRISVPPDFDTMGQEEIPALFGETT